MTPPTDRHDRHDRDDLLDRCDPCGPPDDDTCCVLVDVLDDESAERLAARLKALADPTRIKLVSLLATAPAGELCACDLPGALGKSQPTTSHHLRQLLDVGLIHREQRGKWAWFRLDHDELATLRDALGASVTVA